MGSQTSPPPPLLATRLHLSLVLYVQMPYTVHFFRRHGAPLQWDGTTQTPAPMFGATASGFWVSLVYLVAYVGNLGLAT